ncbi:MAG: bifunctional DNA-formamidopyrimidine glycosylase/DNA-(apurinic or apyrimidinic site) lyase [Deltaproteobacteria bacterium]|nr:bifunctional DNA-formamidopyrimidine glycosylase/DNA-(apurinic or apyrimidinic site) lyase [Deltaproteobacteria bacterium]
MPELPEVESARVHLEGWLVGQHLHSVQVPPTRLLGDQPAELVQATLSGAKVQAVVRRGKHLLVELDRGRALYLHLGMTGKFVARPRGEVVPHARLVLELKERWVIFRDPRLFGRIAVGPRERLWDQYFAPLGPDAWLEPLDSAAWLERLGRTKRPIKVALLEQSLVAGLGNIYAAEALFRARIHPERPASSLSKKECGALAKAVQVTLQKALAVIAQEDELTYLSEGGDNPFLVYERAGGPCVRCQAPIVRTVLGGRSTYHCPACQLNGRPVETRSRPARSK